MLIFKGIDFKTKGIITDTLPKIQKAKKRIDRYEIYGRNGFLSVDNNTYDSWQLTLECHCKDNVDMDDIASYLDGYGTISFDGVKQSTAIVNSNIEFDKIRNSGFQKFLVSFLVNPIFEDINATNRDFTNSFSEQSGIYRFLWQIEPNYRIYPEEIEIEISADTNFYFNNRQFSLKAGHYFLNCKMKEIVDNDGDNASSMMSGDFPYVDSPTVIKATTLPDTFKVKFKKTYLVG